MAKVTRFDPKAAAAAAAAAKKKGESPRMTFSPKTVLWISLLVGIPLILFLGRIGPVRAMQQWQALEPKLTDWTSDVVQKVINEEYKGVKFDEFTRPPKVTNIMLDGPIMMIVLPSEIPLQGRSTEGHFKGTYYTGPRTFELQVGVSYDARTINTRAHLNDKNEVVVDEMKAAP